MRQVTREEAQEAEDPDRFMRDQEEAQESGKGKGNKKGKGRGRGRGRGGKTGRGKGRQGKDKNDKTEGHEEKEPLPNEDPEQPDEKEREAEVDEVKEDKTKPKKTKPRKPAGSPFLERTKAKRALSLEVQRGTPEGHRRKRPKKSPPNKGAKRNLGDEFDAAATDPKAVALESRLYLYDHVRSIYIQIILFHDIN